MKIRMEGLSGIIPRLNASVLPTNAAQIAENVDLRGGTIKPFMASAKVSALEKSGTITGIYRHNNTPGGQLIGAIEGVLLIGTNPVAIVFDGADEYLENGDTVYFDDVGGTTELNGNTYSVYGVGGSGFTLTGTDASLFSAWTSGGTFVKYDGIWMEWDDTEAADGVSVAEAPILSDEPGFLVFTGHGYPRLTYDALQTASPYPTASYRLGVPAPLRKPAVTLNGSGSGAVTAHSYVYTFLCTYGAEVFEGPPSPPSDILSTQSGNDVDLDWIETETYGEALNSDVDFLTGTGWTAGGDWSIDTTDERAEKSATTIQSDLTQADIVPATASNVTYRVVFRISGYSAGSVTPIVDGSSGTARSADGEYSETFSVDGGVNGDFILRATDTFVGNIEYAYLIDTSTGWESILATHVNIYRLVPGSQGQAGLYYYIGQIAIGTDTYNDDLGAVGDPIQTTLYDPPPATLEHIQAIGNGMMAGIDTATGELCYCQPDRPHAWPGDYKQKVPGTPVGLRHFSNTVIVLAYPNIYLGVGTNPASVELIRVASLTAALSHETSMDWGNRGAAFASSVGIEHWSGAYAVQNIMEPFIDSKGWRELRPYNMRLFFWQGRILISFLNAGTREAYILDGGSPWMIKIDEEIDIAHYSPQDGALYFVDADKKVNELFGHPTISKTMTWKSKRFNVNETFDPAVVFLEGIDAAGGGNTVKIYLDGTLYDTRTGVVDVPVPFDTAAGGRKTPGFVEIEVIGDQEVSAIVLADSVESING